MNEKFERLKNLLSTLFQMDQADLDFGLYRIMNAKREEVKRFLDTDLKAMVRSELDNLGGDKQEELQRDLKEAEDSARNAGFDPNDSPVVKKIRAELAKQVNVADLENDIYSYLADFFSRYYDNGDFISKRRYKDDVYAIPYQGEEVKLYWANHDQYYIKTAENFATFSFKLGEGRRVQFQIMEASTERDNNKSQNGDRYFELSLDDAGKPRYSVEGETLILYFTYQTRADKAKQSDLNDEAVRAVLGVLTKDDALKPFVELATKAPTDKNKDRTLLEKQLTTYTSKNSFDYFIHKDLRGFLTRELDFFIKNEVLRVDDLNAEHMSAVVGKVRAFKAIALAVIAFLSQLEEFQKKLWLKKKFVVSADYFMTLDYVDPAHYPAIVANTDQLDEWVSLGFIDEVDVVDVAYLEAHPYLVLDTKFFPDLKNTLLAGFDNLDEQTDGVLINSENFQALNLLQERYREQVQCIYIDPPYNTGSDGFVYKDNYQHSSWLSMINDRIFRSRLLLAQSGIFMSSIDELAFEKLNLVLENLFLGNSLGHFIWKARSGKGGTNKQIAMQHEFILLYGVDSNLVTLKPDIRIGSARREQLRQWGQGDRREDRPSMFYPIYTPDGSKVLPIRDDGSEGRWRVGQSTMDKLIQEGLVQFEKTDAGIQAYRLYEAGNVTESAVDSLIVDMGTASTGTIQIKNLFNNKVFNTTKPLDLIQYLIEESIYQATIPVVLDYFAGSGTTGHAVIKLNREDGGKRRYILVEMGTYFDSVTKPRIQKVIYSDNWRDGKPQDTEGISQLVKYFKLESYEDTLNNLELTPRSGVQDDLLQNNDGLRRDFILNYMLDVETRSSQSLLNVEAFRNPFDYTLRILGNDNELVEQSIDLIETFNYLLGLHVHTRDVVDGVVVIQGHLVQTGERVLVLWRDVDAMNSLALNEFLKKSAYNPLDGEFDIIFVNGDNHIENMKTGEETWKVRLIEAEFHARMFS